MLLEFEGKDKDEEGEGNFGANNDSHEDEYGEEEEQDLLPWPELVRKKSKNVGVEGKRTPIKTSIGRVLRRKTSRIAPPQLIRYSSPATNTKSSLSAFRSEPYLDRRGGEASWGRIKPS